MPVTLNGQPAIVTGYGNDFATVCTLDPHGPAFEWSWRGVERIIANGGRFVS